MSLNSNVIGATHVHHQASEESAPFRPLSTPTSSLTSPLARWTPAFGQVELRRLWTSVPGLRLTCPWARLVLSPGRWGSGGCAGSPGSGGRSGPVARRAPDYRPQHGCVMLLGSPIPREIQEPENPGRALEDVLLLSSKMS